MNNLAHPRPRSTSEATTALQWATNVRDALASAGLGRTSRLNGGELTGWTTHMGATGFSLRETTSGQIDWHIVISGRAHLRYQLYKDCRDDEIYELHEPQNPQVLEPRIVEVFTRLGLTVHGILCTGWQTMWDDDVDYNVLTDRPAGLEPGKGCGGFKTWAGAL